MSLVQNWITDNPKGINFKCSCGATVNLQVWIENDLVVFSARCWKCNKKLTIAEHIMIIDLCAFNLMDEIIEKFKRDFNSDAKPKMIRVVK